MPTETPARDGVGANIKAPATTVIKNSFFILSPFLFNPISDGKFRNLFALALSVQPWITGDANILSETRVGDIRENSCILCRICASAGECNYRAAG
jgi:hypothetical protein